MVIPDLSKMRSPNALDRFLSASKEQLTPVQYEEAVAFFADITSSFMTWFSTATDGYMRTYKAGEAENARIEKLFQKAGLSNEYGRAFEHKERKEAALAERSQDSAQQTTLFVDKKGKIVDPNPVSKEQQKANEAQAIAHAKSIMGANPYVDDFELSTDYIDASLPSVMVQKPEVLAATVSDELLHAVLPPNQPLLGVIDEEEFSHILKQIPALDPVLSAAEQAQDSWQDMLHTAPQLLLVAISCSTLVKFNLLKFPLFFYKVLHLSVWLEEHQGEEQTAAWAGTDVAAMQGHLLYLSNLNTAMEMLLGWMLRLFQTQVDWLHTLQGYRQDGSLQQLEQMAKLQSRLKSTLSSGKAKKTERKKAKQSRAVNRKRRK